MRGKKPEQKKKKYPERMKLKKQMQKQNVTYRMLSGVLGISLDASNNKMNGYTDWTLMEIKKIAEYLNLNPAQIHNLFFEDEQEEKE